MVSSPSLPQSTETTPLLVGAREDSAAVQHSTDDHDGAAAEEGDSIRRVTLSRMHRALFFMNAAMAFLIISHAIYRGVIIGMNTYSSSRFGNSDYSFSDSAAVILVDVFMIFFALFNVLRIKTTGRPAPPGINIVVYGCYTFLLFALVAQETSYRLNWSVMHCNRSLDDPDNWYYPGSYAECKAWVKQYMVISWVFIAFQAIVASLSLAITITLFVKVFRERSQNTMDRMFAFRLPTGFVSLNVSLQWGPGGQAGEPARVAEAQAQGEAQPRE